MNALRSKLNWLIIPALVFGMGATGVSNCLQFGDGCGTARVLQPHGTRLLLLQGALPRSMRHGLLPEAGAQPGSAAFSAEVA